MSLRALCLLREDLPYRREAFVSGLRAAGYRVVSQLVDPDERDVICVWNRHGNMHREACRFEAAGSRVVVCENGFLGKSWLGGTWFSLALGHHAGAGEWFAGGPERWDALGVELQPWRDGTETVILGQRAIGEPGIASPDRWAETTQERIGGRIRAHPARTRAGESLEADLAHASSVVTWASAAALRALLMGVPVWHEFPQWIGAQASRPLSEWGQEPSRDDADRLSMFRRLAWAIWRQDDIGSGAAFEHLLM